MTPAAVILRSCLLIILVFAAAANLCAATQSAATKPASTKPASTQPAATQPGVDPAEDSRHAAALRKIAGDRIDANIRYQNGTIRCRHVEDKDCMHKLEVQHEADLRQILIEGYQEDGTHTKNMIDFNRRQQMPKFTGKAAAEDLRHYNAETELKKRAVDADTQYKVDKVKCDVFDMHPQIAACVKQAGITFTDNQDQITIAQNIEDGTHTKNLMNINGSAPPK
jgi:hypothetical protein